MSRSGPTPTPTPTPRPKPKPIEVEFVGTRSIDWLPVPPSLPGIAELLGAPASALAPARDVPSLPGIAELFGASAYALAPALDMPSTANLDYQAYPSESQSSSSSSSSSQPPPPNPKTEEELKERFTEYVRGEVSAIACEHASGGDAVVQKANCVKMGYCLLAVLHDPSSKLFMLDVATMKANLQESESSTALVDYFECLYIQYTPLIESLFDAWTDTTAAAAVAVAVAAAEDEEPPSKRQKLGASGYATPAVVNLSSAEEAVRSYSSKDKAAQATMSS
ncbi:hypothetical protein B0T24DRAFT_672007 [Lasiosphaeria ovina]|uniref:Uncharacterized protein n=1 Tax=Lasiosphaeria ovina TaxID=92902 RepID=A0AAE0JRV4_9PEZI|nr:hypothetical protein B0T24DRAFT_672007 [Lasiosphaeria ovina]